MFKTRNNSDQVEIKAQLNNKNISKTFQQKSVFNREYFDNNKFLIHKLSLVFQDIQVTWEIKQTTKKYIWYKYINVYMILDFGTIYMTEDLQLE